MWCSTFRTITRENRLNISEFEKEWRTNKVLGRSPKGSRGVFSNFSYILARGYGIREGERAWVKTLRIDCRMITIHCPRENSVYSCGGCHSAAHSPATALPDR